MISVLSGYALLLAGAAYAVKFWLSDPAKTSWPRACLALRALWLVMTGGCALSGIMLARGTATINPTGAMLIFTVAVISIGEAAKIVKGGGIPRRAPKPDGVQIVRGA